MTRMHSWLAQAARGRARHGQSRTAESLLDRDDSSTMLDLASNDYLGLATDARLAAAANEAIIRCGTGAGASRVVTGTTMYHERVEQELAHLTGQPSALVFSSGYTANLGVLSALGGPQTLLALDAHAHASLIDGARLSRSPVEFFTHNDVCALEKLLATRTQPRAIVAVESVYSVLGDLADLAHIAEVCARHDALVVVDEAHGLGVMGSGRGAVHAAGLADAEHVVVTATLSKALGTQGGVVLGSELLRDHLISTARTFLFDTALAPASAAAAAAACRIIATEPQRVHAVEVAADHMASAARIDRAPGAVQSIPVGSAHAAVEVTRRLRQRGILVGCFRPPSVPDGIARIRLTARATADLQHIATAAVAVATLAHEIGQGR